MKKVNSAPAAPPAPLGQGRALRKINRAKSMLRGTDTLKLRQELRRIDLEALRKSPMKTMRERSMGAVAEKFKRNVYFAAETEPDQ